QRLPGRVIEFRVGLRAHQTDLTYPAFGGEAPQFGVRGRRVGLRQHRHPDQAIWRGGAEFHQPIVVDAIAGLAQRRVVGRDLKDRAENDLRLDAVAVHVLETQFGDGRAPLALVIEAAAVEGVVDRLDGPRVRSGCPWRRRLAAPGAPHLAVADPHGLAVALVDI